MSSIYRRKFPRTLHPVVFFGGWRIDVRIRLSLQLMQVRRGRSFLRRLLYVLSKLLLGHMIDESADATKTIPCLPGWSQMFRDKVLNTLDGVETVSIAVFLSPWRGAVAQQSTRSMAMMHVVVGRAAKGDSSAAFLYDPS